MRVGTVERLAGGGRCYRTNLALGTLFPGAFVVGIERHPRCAEQRVMTSIETIVEALPETEGGVDDPGRGRDGQRGR